MQEKTETKVVVDQTRPVTIADLVNEPTVTNLVHTIAQQQATMQMQQAQIVALTQQLEDKLNGREHSGEQGEAAAGTADKDA